MGRKKYIYAITAGSFVAALSAAPLVLYKLNHIKNADDDAFYLKSFEKMESKFFKDVFHFAPLDINYSIFGKYTPRELELKTQKELQDKLNDFNADSKIYKDALIDSKAIFNLLGDMLSLEIDTTGITNYKSEIRKLVSLLKVKPDQPLDPVTNFNSNIFKDDEKLDKFKSIIEYFFKDKNSWMYSDDNYSEHVNHENLFVNWKDFFFHNKGKQLSQTLRQFVTTLVVTFNLLLSDNGVFENAKKLNDYDKSVFDVPLLQQINEVIQMKTYTYVEDFVRADTPLNALHEKGGKTLQEKIDQWISVTSPVSDRESNISNYIKQYQTWASSDLKLVTPAIGGADIFGLLGNFLKLVSRIDPDAEKDVITWGASLNQLMSNPTSLFGYTSTSKYLVGFSEKTKDAYTKFASTYTSRKKYVNFRDAKQYQVFRMGFNVEKYKNFMSKYNVNDDFVITVNKYYQMHITKKDFDRLIEEYNSGTKSGVNMDVEEGYIYPKNVGNNAWTIRSNDELHFSKLNFKNDSALSVMNGSDLANKYIFTPTWSINTIYDYVSVEFELKHKLRIGEE